jgi:hypothetical protein
VPCAKGWLERQPPLVSPWTTVLGALAIHFGIFKAHRICRKTFHNKKPYSPLEFFRRIAFCVFYTPRFMPSADHYPHDLYVVWVLCAVVCAFFLYAFWDVGQVGQRKKKDKKAAMYKSV